VGFFCCDFGRISLDNQYLICWVPWKTVFILEQVLFLFGKQRPLKNNHGFPVASAYNQASEGDTGMFRLEN